MRYELIVNINGKNQYLDTYDEEGISLNYNIADINDISSKNSSYSKTITLPDTKINRATFEYIFNLNSDSTFDPTKKSLCYVLKDTIIVFQGYLQLTSIQYDRQSNNNLYNVIIYADNSTLYANIGEKYLTDLNLSHINHLWNTNSIVNSWNGNSQLGYYYPLIDYKGDLTAQLVGGYATYSFLSATSGSTHSITATYSPLGIYDLFPAVYLKTIVDEIILEAGYGYQSEFFNSNFYNNLIIPYNNTGTTLQPSPLYGLTLSSTNVLFLSQCNTTVSPSYTLLEFGDNIGVAGSLDNNGDVTVYDPNSFYDTTNYVYTNNYSYEAFAQQFTIEFNIELDDGAQLGSSASGAPWVDNLSLGYYDDAYIIIKRSFDPITGLPVAGFSNTPTYYNLLPYAEGGWPSIIIANGSELFSLRWLTQNTVSGSSAALYYVGTSVGRHIYSLEGTITSDILGALNSGNNPLLPGEQVRFFFARWKYNYVDSSHIPSTYLLSSIIYSTVYPSMVVPGSIVNGALNLPNNIKQKDFLTSVNKMFNLIYEPDPNNANNFIIEPAPTFYQNYGEVLDWSQKLDISQTITSEILSNTQARRNKFMYTADKDYWNTYYTSATNQIYGQYEWDINNDFITGETDIQPIFSPTIIDLLLGSQNIYLPTIINSSYGSGNNTQTTNGFNIRILYKNILPTNSDIFNFNGITYSFYPYAGAFDNPISPSVSLNFGQVPAFYPNFTDTVNNLFYLYYQDQMEEISDKDSRIVTAYFNLTSQDINNFSFANTIFFTIDGNDGYYRVNKIIDYDPSQEISTQVELIKSRYFNP